MFLKIMYLGGSEIMSGKLFGYVRVSTVEQNLDRQIDILKRDAGVSDENIFSDKITGTIMERPAFQNLQKSLREGDTVVTESLSRLSRSTKDLLSIIEDWQKRGITYISLKENLDFSSSTGKLILTVMASICEFERNTIRDRICEGLASSRSRGRIGGRPKTDNKMLSKALKLYESKSLSISEITEATGVSKSVLYRALKEQKENSDINK